MKYEWFLFDLDGTLTESAEGIVNCAKHALSRLGVEIPADEAMRAFIGPPLKWSFMTIAGLDEAAAVRAVELYRERYSELGWKENRVYPGIAQLIRGIKRRGGKIALASAKPEKFCLRILEYFGLMPYFDRVSAIGLDNHSAEKLDIIMKALPEASERANAVMVGDRIYDIEGAKAAGVKCVGVEYGYGAPEEFKDADAVAKTPAGLWDILVGGPRDRGYFVTFEGVDGSGKSTQFRRAVEWLDKCGWEMTTTREPGGCPISERIRELLLDVASKGMTAKCEAMLYAAAREQHVQQVILPSLEAGKLVMCDRFLDSSEHHAFAVSAEIYGPDPFVQQGI